MAMELERLPTRISGLDAILRGGFLRGGVYIVQGTPGAGKTILANEICFRYAAAGGRAVYVTLLAESHGRMLQHLRAMSFFDERAIPEALYYVSAFRTLEEEGLKGLVALLRREIRGQRAGLLVLDGLVAAEESAGSAREFKKFIHELQSHAAADDCTVLLLTSGTGGPVRAEHTMVDGLVELGDERLDVRTERSLTVHKFRGSGFLRGRHAFRITGEGIRLFPRIETTCLGPAGESPGAGRLGTGIDGLDAMLRGGLPVGSNTGIVGATGTGKTSIGLHFIGRSSEAEPGLLFGFYETPLRLEESAASQGIDLAGLIRRGHVEVIWHPQGENIVDELAHRLLDAIRRRRAARLVIDGLSGFLEAMAHPERTSRFLACLTNELRALGTTTLLTVEARQIVGPSIELPVEGVSALLENIIFLRLVERESRLHRMISVTKLRASGLDGLLREFTIGADGIRIGEPFFGAERVITGVAREARPAARRRTKSK